MWNDTYTTFYGETDTEKRICITNEGGKESRIEGQ